MVKKDTKTLYGETYSTEFETIVDAIRLFLF